MKKIWLKNYPSSVPEELPESKIGLLEEFEKTCKKFQDQTAFISFGVKLSYRDLYQKSFQLAQFLKSKGLEPDSVMALQLPNLLQYPVSLWGSLMAGLKILNLNPLYKAKEMLLPLRETKSQGLILLPDTLKELEEIIDQTELCFLLVTQPGDLLQSFKKPLINFGYQYKTKTWKTVQLKNQFSFLSAFENSTDSNSTSFNSAIKQNLKNEKLENLKRQNFEGHSESYKPEEETKQKNLDNNQKINLLNPKQEEDTERRGLQEELEKDQPSFIEAKLNKESSKNIDQALFIQYTGGTTGVIKGACLSEKNVLSNAKQCQIWMGHWLKESEEVALSALPLYHIFSFTVNGLVFFFHGYPNVLIADPRDIPSLIRTLKKQKITVGTGVNTLFKALVSNKKFKSIKNLKVFVSGGMALDPSVREKWEALTRGLLVEGYGLTEASPVVCVDRLDHQKDNSAGYPLPSTEIRIVDDNQKELEINQVGELEVKGPQVMQAYFKQSEETKKVLSLTGWLKTGDLAKINPRGGIEILGRKKELINISGLKVYPREVEELLSLHPKVKEVAIVGRKNKEGEEIVKAYIVKKQDSLNKKEILSYCKKNLAPYKVPKEISFQKSFVKSSVGKPLKRVLK